MIKLLTVVYHIQFKLLSENKLIICALGNLHYQISREKFAPELGAGMRTRIAQVVERQARNLEVRGLNPGSFQIFLLSSDNGISLPIITQYTNASL